MFNTAMRGLPKAPPFAMGRTAQPGEVTPGGVPWSKMLDRFPPHYAQDEEAQAPESTGLPKAPPKALSNNPFSKDNRQQTLLSIGQAFLSSPDFFQGLGSAAGAVNGRIDELKGLQAAQRPKVSYGGPDDRFEISEAPDGTRSIREVPEFAKVLDDKAARKDAPSPKEVIEMRARAVHAIGQLPEDQRAAAYANLLGHPDMYGGLDVSNMPPGWDPNYAAVMGGLGTSVSQDENADYRERALRYRNAQAERRLDQAQQRINKPPASRLPQTKPPAGFTWE